ncbi:hypothetical protein DCAR_0309791 [Daucus carota subsp. sativus]|uniref:Uncharacterized protein n=1 Tax=Daucus carota subsp. sativus TaxID=79200 RepID=A0AAF0WIK1_DAUCS|nr:hypothetical protein DCAR_0309791 [Daucus carota subsp. sativus]
MATIMSQLNLKMMGSKHDKVLAYPSCCTRQVTSSVNFARSLSHNIYSNSRLLSTAYQSCTSSSLRENYYCNNVADPFAAEKVVMMMKPSVGKSTNPGPSIRDFVDTISRILASLLTYGVVFTFLTVPACFYASNSAWAVSSGRIGGSSSSSSSSSYGSSSSSYGSSSSGSYYYSDDDDEGYSKKDDSSITHTCTCDTSCTKCIDCQIRKNGKQEKQEEENKSSTNSSCSCNCHSTSNVYVDMEEQKADDETMLIFQVGVLDKKRILQRNLNNIAKNADTSTAYGLNCTLKEVVKALLQHDNSSLKFHDLSLEYQTYLTRGSLDKSFKKNLNELLEGFAGGGITLGNVNGVKYRERIKVNRRVDNEYTMVTVMVLATGHYLIPKKKRREESTLTPSQCCKHFNISQKTKYSLLKYSGHHKKKMRFCRRKIYEDVLKWHQ